METILELHVSGLSEGETPTFRIQPVGPNAGEPVFLTVTEFSILAAVLDRASREPPPDWHGLRQAILRGFYGPETRRG